MNETEWLVSTDPQVMLTTLRALTTPGQVGFVVPGRVGQVAYYTSDRKLWLFACACCRQVWDGAPCPRKCYPTTAEYIAAPRSFTNVEGLEYACDCTDGRVGGLADPRSRRAVEVTERYADGEATEDEFADACADATMSETWATGGTVVGWCRCDFGGSSVPPAVQAALLRDIFGNPFRPPHHRLAASEIWRWNDGTVPRIARRIYGERRWGDIGVLGDALLDAGCDDEAILRHCRGEERCGECMGLIPRRQSCDGCDGTGWRKTGAPHVRGCWVVDLILGKE